MAPRSALSALAVAALSIHSACAAPAPEPKVVSFEFHKKSVSADLPYRRLGRRAASSYTGTIYNAESGSLYLINATIGTPGQPVQLQLDTGSSDIWVPWVNSNLCEASGDLCSTGSFDLQTSSTFTTAVADGFIIDYGDGTEVTGDYIKDTFSIAGATVTQMTMGLAKEQTGAPGGSEALFTGLVGVGFDTNEAIYSQSNDTTDYPNIISQLVLQSKINTRAYSLWLNDLEATSGTILFGGVDSSKYTGDLVVLPLQNDVQSGIINSFTVTLAGIKVTGTNGQTVYSSSEVAPVLLDSGTTFTYVPADVAFDILTGVGAVNDTDLGVIVSCDLAQSSSSVDFQFGNSAGPTISVPLSEFVYPISDPAPTFKGGASACSFGLLPDSGNGIIFGDTFLRSAYVVYNIEGETCAIAQSNINSTSASNVKEITASNSIPGATSTATGSVPAGATLGVASGAIPVVSGTANIPTATSGLFNLASGTASSGKATSTATKGAAAGLAAPSTSFVGTIAMGVTVLFSMIGGSMLILV